MDMSILKNFILDLFITYGCNNVGDVAFCLFLHLMGLVILTYMLDFWGFFIFVSFVGIMMFVSHISKDFNKKLQERRRKEVE
jgi:hypothetical protein